VSTVTRAAFDPSAAAPPDSGLFGLNDPLESARVVIVPVPFDATTSYRRGAATGPAAILRASHQIDLFDLQTGRPYATGIHLLPEDTQVRAWNLAASAAADPIIAVGGVLGDSSTEEGRELHDQLAQVNTLQLEVEHWVHGTVDRLLAAGKLVGVLGGDHSVPLGAIKALARRCPAMGILHIDAHADLRAAYEGFAQSHASIMYNVVSQIPEIERLVQVGLRDVCAEEVDLIRYSGRRIRAFFDTDLAAERDAGVPWGRLCERIVGELPQKVYISFDIDGLEPSLCPHTGTPVPGGLRWNELLALLQTVVRSGRHIVGFDLTEVAPSPDPSNEWDANVGARALYKLIGFSLLSQAAAT
jgi:agmatinase